MDGTQSLDVAWGRAPRGSRRGTTAPQTTLVELDSIFMAVRGDAAGIGSRTTMTAAGASAGSPARVPVVGWGEADAHDAACGRSAQYASGQDVAGSARQRQ